MCKLAAWTASRSLPLTKHAADAALVAAHSVIARTERDGFGFSQSHNGLRGRFVAPEDFRSLDALPRLHRRAGDSVDAFQVAWSAEQTGNYNPSRSTLVHGRTATCGVSLANTHPFRHAGWTLAHNGVVSWHGDDTPQHKAATCDSQHILYALADGKGTKERKHLLESLTGYAAFLAFSPAGEFIVARDATAPLFAGITGKGRWLFGTTPAIVEALADAMRSKHCDPFRLDDWTWLEFPANGGKPVASTWHHAEASAREWTHSKKSLGKTWHPATTGSTAPAPVNGTKHTAAAQEFEFEREEFPDWEPNSTARPAFN